ncbi:MULTISPECIES: YIEGIA family protein [Oceanobacillus]|uniref:Membrane protein n=1 Tax=Oceanobacillus kimchii TaxID=746691 RepID=A0ABQ5TJ13_9BACI|nr:MULTISPECIES: YIEGIA family protein [Oceanobacillus]MBT2598448.1 YIEGIA family protein [Oceanobacillus sp. ISL-74]MBT2651366.1 YIEGIA family protein [Oceanobacillus sp. ISL-73]MCT1576025.1 YIEGIA family protein [Oceanobacillus kimchii]MCT2135662.1 YIEGIA family protein [Oceanobacillus kimchii]GLO66455.1 membrane protein [Oceanobacillus kimchii]
MEIDAYLNAILFGVVTGTVARLLTLRSDYRQYPTYLHGRIIHLSLGFIAASLGALAIPALLEMQFTAVTFLTVAATQFRDVRNMERNTLTELDGFELVSRGNTYIEGIAISFESRNYLVMFTAFFTTLAYIAWGWFPASVVAILSFIVGLSLMSGSTLKDIVDIEQSEISFDGAGLYVDNIYIMNIGLPERQEEILEHGMGFILKPKNINIITTIANLGQRQAILHDVSVSLGVFRDSGTPALTPLIKRDLADGRLGVFILPLVKDAEKAKKVIGAVPVLESAVRMPSESKPIRRNKT